MANAKSKARTSLFEVITGRPFVSTATCITVGLLGSCIWASPGSDNGMKGTRTLSYQQPSNRLQVAQLEDTAGDNTDQSEDSDDLDFSEGIDISDIGDEEVVVADEDVVQSTSKIEWLDSNGNQCYRSKQNKGFCEGPRRVPKPHGAEAALAMELGLGRIETVWRLLSDAPEPSWVQAARGNAAGNEQKQVKLMWPVVDGKRIRGFGKVGEGKRRHLHKGIDIGADEGTLFVAVADGIVAYSDNQVRGYGNLLAVVHGDGSVALYSHNRALYVFAGQRVRRGQPLGEVGHTGFARCDHLHFEYRIKGLPRNPQSKFEKTSPDEDNEN